MQLYFISRVLFPPLYFFLFFSSQRRSRCFLFWVDTSRGTWKNLQPELVRQKSRFHSRNYASGKLLIKCLDLFYNDILLLFNNVISLALPTIVLMFPLTRNLSLKSKNRGWLQIFEIYIGLSLQTLDILWSEEIRIPWRLVSHLLKY